MLTIAERITTKISRNPDTGCWIWTGSLTVSGGYAQLAGPDHRPIRVNRWILQQKLGRPLGTKMCALHHCDTPSCVNPDHLFEGTRKDNTHDMMKKGRGRYWPNRPVTKGESHPSAKLTDRQVEEIRALRTILSGMELSERYGVSRPYIYALTNGRARL